MANILNLGLSAVATGTVDVITATYSPAITLTDRRIVYLRTLGTNTVTAPTFNPNGLGAQTITKGGGSALAVGDLDGDVILMYDLTNTNWELLTPKAVSSSTPTLAQVLGAGQSVDETSILSQNNLNYFQMFDAAVVLAFDDGLGGDGDLTLNDLLATLRHTVGISLDSPIVKLPQETASRILSLDASSNIESLSTTTYPSLTELAYVKGVTSAIQAQLDSKGYPLQGSCTSITTVNDATNYYFADPNIGTSTSADVVGLTIPKTAILKKAVIYAKVAGTLASAENSTIYLRLNATTDVTLSAAVTLTATTQVITSGALNQAVTAGDFFAFKFTSATFATNPTTVSFTVSLFFEYA